MIRVLKSLSKYKNIIFWVIFIIFILSFSIGLMHSTFFYTDNTIYMGSKLWSDFLSHIPLIRSFSHGDNYPIEYPLYSGEPIRYHFLFYMMVGYLEKLGLSIDWALNIPSILGLFGLLLIISIINYKQFKSKIAVFLGSLMIIFNSSLNFIYYFLIGKQKVSSWNELINIDHFPAFGPYNDTIISAFWNLNVITNQRHLAFSFALLFLGLYLLFYKRSIKTLILGVLILCLLSLMHKVAWGIGLVGIIGLVVLHPKSKRYWISLLLIILLSIPGMMFFTDPTQMAQIRFLPGFNYNSTTWWEMNINSEIIKWVMYWFLNSGFLFFFCVIGFGILIRKYWNKASLSSLKKTLQDPNTYWFYLSIAIFIFANLFVFSVDNNGNHKFFNFTFFIWGIYASYGLVMIIKKISILGILFIPILILGGVLDIIPIINDKTTTINDIGKNKTSSWIEENTPKNSVFLGLSGNYDFITITGRKLFWGPEYFNWSIGYPLEKRADTIYEFMNTDNKEMECEYLIENDIDYLYMLDSTDRSFRDSLEYMIDIEKYKNTFITDNTFPDKNYLLFDISYNCRL